MLVAILLLGLLALLISAAVTAAMIRIAPAIGFVDKPGHRKIHSNPKPLGGGVGIFWGFALPMLLLLLGVHIIAPGQAMADALGVPLAELQAYWDGARLQTRPALVLVFAAMALHVLGLYDDRRALGPYTKLVVQMAAAVALVIGADMRVLTTLDALGLGPMPSIVLSVMWIVAITNAFNFLDNMDGLSAGVAAVCAAAFLVTALSIEQWFVAGSLALVLGAALGFLLFNFPPARIFQGDAGSLVLGLLLGALTIKTTYLPAAEAFQRSWYTVLAPVVVLAVPLYDLVVVSALRISRGKSPLVGDTNHLSHRLVARGMSRRTAVLCIYLMTAATAVAAIMLPHLPRQLGPLIFVQLVLVLGLVMLLEQHPLPPGRGD